MKLNLRLALAGSSVALTLAQSPQQLTINSFLSFTPASVPNPPTFAVPVSNSLSISIAFCSDNSQSPNPRFFITNDSAVHNPGSSNVGTSDVFEIVVKDGLGVWTGSFNAGGLLGVEDVNQMAFEVGVSDGGE
jgi:calcium channel MID1